MLQNISAYKTSFKTAMRLALPIMAGQLGQILMGFFDTIQIGGLGAEYIAASGLANTIYWLVTLLGLGVLFGVAPLVSEAFGEQQKEKSIGILNSSLLVAVALSVVFTALVFVVVANFHLFRQPENINPLASRYLYIVNFTTPAMMLFTAGRQFVDGMGRTIPGMVINLAALVLNIFLNWLLIYGNLGLPALGIEGAALATSISRTAMMAAILYFIFKDKQVREMRCAYRKSAFKKHSFVKPVLVIGIPATLQVSSEAASFCTAHIMCGWLGDMELAAHQIAINLASITFMAVTGISAAGTIMTGYAFGAKDAQSIRISGKTVIMLTIALELIFVIVFLGGNKLLPKLYTNEATLIAMASSLILLAVLFQLSDGLQNAAVGVLRGIQDVKIPALLAFTSYWLIMIPSCYFLAFHFGLGVKGIWVGFIIGLSSAAAMLIARFFYLTHPKNLNRLLFNP